MVAAGNDFLEYEDGGVSRPLFQVGSPHKKIAAYLPFAVAFVLSVGMGYCVLGPFAADLVHGHVLHLNHQQPLQKAAFAPMQLAGRLTRHSAPVTANKIAMSDLQPEGERQKGKVLWYNPTKGWGFIGVEGGGDDLFVHRAQVKASGYRSLAVGADVEFKIDQDETGRLQAYELTLPEGDKGEIQKGKVVRWNSTKGFGFIAPEGGGDDVFVHQSQIYAQGYRSLAEGEDVEFKVETNPKNGQLRATEVTGPEGNYVKGSYDVEDSYWAEP